MLLNLTELSVEPLHRQISRQLTDKIVEGELSDGAELLPINVLARSQHVSKSTVQRAYESLEKSGLINSKQGKGFFVAALTSAQKQAIVKQRMFGNWSSLNVVESLEKQKLTEELNMARKIQKDLLPKELPNNEYFQIAAYSKLSLAVGGDFYDYLPIDEHRFGLVIGDACGKGLSAAMLISQMQVMLKNDVRHNTSIQETMNEKKEEYSEPRLLNLIKHRGHLDAQDIIQAVISDLDTFQNSSYVQDDRTILMLKVLDLDSQPGGN